MLFCFGYGCSGNREALCNEHHDCFGLDALKPYALGNDGCYAFGMDASASVCLDVDALRTERSLDKLVVVLACMLSKPNAIKLNASTAWA